MSLKTDLVDILNSAHDDTWGLYRSVKANAIRLGLDPNKTAKWKGPGEPALTYSVMNFWSRSHFSRAIKDNFPTLSSIGSPLISYSFFHQKPKVNYDEPGGLNNPIEIELGDLLVVRQHFQFGTVKPQGRAFIIQAKVSPGPETGKLSKEDVKQLNLYKNWGYGFTFPYGEFGNPSNATKWDFSNGTSKVDETGVYGVVLSTERCASPTVIATFPDKCVWGIGFTKDEVLIKGKPSIPAQNLSLADALSKLVTGDFGRPWESHPINPDDHWSEFINEALVSAVMRSSFSALQRIGGVSVPRTGDVLGFATNMPGVALALSPSHENYYSHSHEEIGKQIVNWIDSLGKYAELPPRKEKFERAIKPEGGMSLIYIATFGEGALGEVSAS